MISDIGAKIAAGKLGITVREYRLHEERDEAWCPRCADWLPRTAFHEDRSKARGLAGLCRECHRDYDWSYYDNVTVSARLAGRSS